MRTGAYVRDLLVNVCGECMRNETTATLRNPNTKLQRACVIKLPADEQERQRDAKHADAKHGAPGTWSKKDNWELWRSIQIISSRELHVLQRSLHVFDALLLFMLAPVHVQFVACA